jgi:hypothetical protein
VLLAACGLSAGNEKSAGLKVEMPDKFTQFTFHESCREPDPLLASILAAKNQHATILDLLQFYAEQIAKDPSVHAPYFDHLQRIFECGVTPKTMQGYFHGAVIAFRNQALLNLFDVNSLNMKWPLARIFSPWTGKTFEPIEEAKLRSITGNYFSDTASATWGANTYTSRSVKQRISVDLMRLLGIHLVEAPAGEKAAHDYEVKGFFFIGTPARSVNPDNQDRQVYQFNYRWPPLETFVPDNYCIDEIVQIAQGLFLGQLVYATEIVTPYDPATAPQTYRYKNFGFWLLMDDDWQRRRQEISFDMNG